MNYRLIALASCVALGSIALGGKAQAQVVNVPFVGAVINVCTFGVPVPGVLARNGSLMAVEGSSGVTGLGSTGTTGLVTLLCTGSASTVSVAPPVAVAVPAGFSPAVLQSVVQRGANTGAGDYTSANSGGVFDGAAWTTLGGTGAMAVPAGLSILNVGMVAGTNSTGVLPSGLYTYNVPLTATPN